MRSKVNSFFCLRSKVLNRSKELYTKLKLLEVNESGGQVGDSSEIQNGVLKNL